MLFSPATTSPSGTGVMTQLVTSTSTLQTPSLQGDAVIPPPPPVGIGAHATRQTPATATTTAMRFILISPCRWNRTNRDNRRRRAGFPPGESGRGIVRQRGKYGKRLFALWQAPR